MLRLSASVLLVACLAASTAYGLDPAKHLSQYGHTAWRTQDGFFSGAATAITQTRDGYIWIATNTGLVRFDGVKFSPIPLSDGDALRDKTVLSLFADEDGSLWIGTFTDLEHYQNGRLTHFPAEPGQILGKITRIFRAQDGQIWFADATRYESYGPICSVRDRLVKCFRHADGVDATHATDLIEDKDGSFWIVDDSGPGLSHWDPKTHQRLGGGGTESIGGSGDSTQLGFDVDGSLLVANQSGNWPGLFRARAGRLEPVKVDTFDGRRTAATSIFRDSKDEMWIGTLADGVYRINGNHAEHYGTREGLSDDSVEGFYEDREGNIWVATNRGVDRFRDTVVATYSTHEGLSNNSVGAVLAGKGEVWVGNVQSIDVLHSDGAVTALRGGKEISDLFVRSLMLDRRNRLWMGTEKNLQILAGRVVKTLSPLGTVTAIVEDRVGDVWAVSTAADFRGQLLHFADDKLIEQISFDQLPVVHAPALAPDPQDGIWLPISGGNVAHWARGKAEQFDLHHPPGTGSVTGIVARADGTVYASSRRGIAVIRDGTVRTLSLGEGLPCAVLYAMTDTDDALWISSECGILEIRYSDLDGWWNDSTIHPPVVVFDASDGAQPAMNCCFPRAANTIDGRVWFTNGTVLQMIDPKKRYQPRPPLPVLIEQIVAGGKTYPTSSEVAFPPLTKDLQLDFTSPSFASPEKLRFRYMLEGVNDAWVETGTRRQVSLANLRPGDYRFRVSASIDSRTWIPESTISFQLIPKFYQAAWFTWVCVALAVLMLALILRIRIRVEKREVQARMQVRMDERERIARELHDTLFQDIQGVLLTIDTSTNQLRIKDPTRLALEDALRQSDVVMARSRERVLELRSDNVRREVISDALERMCSDLAGPRAPSFRVTQRGVEKSLDPVVFKELFLICREALLNACRHSGGQQVDVEVEFTPRTVSVRISDDGTGIENQVLAEGGKTGHFGLRGMTERATKIGATLVVRRRSQRGTEVLMEMPADVASGSHLKRWHWPWEKARPL